MSDPHEEWLLDTRRLGRRVLLFARLDSTNTYAASLAGDTSNDGLVILADEQTAGRGQYGRRWQCEPGVGVLLSILLFPPLELRRPALLTAWAAVSVCETIQQLTGLQATIKWPNDVLIQGKKVCGILIEQARAAVVGIGLNVNQTAESFVDAALPDAASLTVFTGKRHDIAASARRLIGNLDEAYDRLCQGDTHTLEACWKERIGLQDKPVTAECHDGSVRGVLRKMSWNGLELLLKDGSTRTLAPEVIRHLDCQSV